MFEPVCTTSWPRRHWQTFGKLAKLLAEEPADPVIVLIGPGGVSRPMRRLMPAQTDVRPAKWRRAIRNLPRFMDQALRRIPVMPLVSYEPAELAALIQRPYRLVAVDISRRVLTAVKREYPLTQTYCVDLAREPIPVMGDVVIVFSVLTRTADPPRAMQHVLGSLRPGGLIVIDDRSANNWLPGPPAFVPVVEQIFRRQA